MKQLGVLLSHINANSISISGVTVGASAEEVAMFIQAAVSGATQEASAKIAALAQRLGATKEALIGILRILGDQGVVSYDLPGALGALVQQVLLLKQSLTSEIDRDNETSGLRRLAVEALDRGDLSEAEELLERLKNEERLASDRIRSQIAEQTRQLRESLEAEVRTIVNLGRLALARGNFIRARTMFQEGE